MTIKLGYVGISSSISFTSNTEDLVGKILREERMEKLQKLQKIVDNEKDVISLHDEIFKNSK